MPRSKVVTVNGKQVNVKEYKIRELREDVLPRLTSAMDNMKIEEIATKNLGDVIPILEGKLVEFFPELTEADIDEAYPSEIEALIEAWVDVNFTGLKRIYRPVLALAKMGAQL